MTLFSCQTILHGSKLCCRLPLLRTMGIITSTATVLMLLSVVILTNDCHYGYCLPAPENFLFDLSSNLQRTLTVSSTCANSSMYTKFPDTGER